MFGRRAQLPASFVHRIFAKSKPINSKEPGEVAMQKTLGDIVQDTLPSYPSCPQVLQIHMQKGRKLPLPPPRKRKKERFLSRVHVDLRFVSGPEVGRQGLLAGEPCSAVSAEPEGGDQATESAGLT